MQLQATAELLADPGRPLAHNHNRRIGSCSRDALLLPAMATEQPASLGPTPLRSALKTEDDASTPPASGSLKGKLFPPNPEARNRKLPPNTFVLTPAL